MKFDVLVKLVRDLDWFDLATVVQLTDERRASITNQLYRFAAAGKLMALRRGMYTLSEPYRRAVVQPAALANALLRPSYLSEAWALSHYGLIPESVRVFTSVTTRSPDRFVNAFGEFAYRHLSPALFGDYEPVLMTGTKVLLARPEKALLDFFHLSSGAWTEARMREMRFASHGLVDEQRLASLARRMGKPRLLRAVGVWSKVVADDARGEREL